MECSRTNDSQGNAHGDGRKGRSESYLGDKSDSLTDRTDVGEPEPGLSLQHPLKKKLLRRKVIRRPIPVAQPPRPSIPRLPGGSLRPGQTSGALPGHEGEERTCTEEMLLLFIKYHFFFFFFELSLRRQPHGGWSDLCTPVTGEAVSAAALCQPACVGYLSRLVIRISPNYGTSACHGH